MQSAEDAVHAVFKMEDDAVGDEAGFAASVSESAAGRNELEVVEDFFEFVGDFLNLFRCFVVFGFDGSEGGGDAVVHAFGCFANFAVFVALEVASGDDGKGVFAERKFCGPTVKDLHLASALVFVAGAVKDVGFGCFSVATFDEDFFDEVLDLFDIWDVVFAFEEDFEDGGDLISDFFGKSAVGAADGLGSAPDRFGDFALIEFSDFAAAFFDFLNERGHGGEVTGYKLEITD